MKPLFWLLLVLLTVGIFSCTENQPEEKLTDDAFTDVSTLNQALNNKKLRVLTDYNTVNYYIYRGEPMGYQYELLKAFSDHLGLRLELRIEKDLGEAKQSLEKGEADMIALNMTVTGDRLRRFDFSEPIIITRQVLVQRLPKNWLQLRTRDEIEKGLIRSSLELAGKTIHVQENSVFSKRLRTLSDEIGDTIYIIEDNRDVEDLVAAVANKDIDYTIADEHMAAVFLRNYTNLDIKTAISFDQKIAWALRKEPDNKLLEEINKWLSDYLPSRDGRLLYDKYFSPLVKNRSQSEYHSVTGDRLSPYDDIIRSAAESINWDWRLMASLIYQESEFKPDVRSWAGAFGLMQLMPGVMEQFNIDSTATPEVQVLVGAQYIQYLDRQIPETVTDTIERSKFILASYNAGVGHVLDARRLAVKYNKNPDVWTDNVDFFMRNKSKPAFYNDPVVYYGYVRGEETFRFVEEITERYEHYKNLIGVEKKSIKRDDSLLRIVF
ncbi:MAG: lytic transglycosylase [Bacteroidetes bacterium]|nr:MAG: lytic transglycosylase [Bacteroidota bacterium]